MVLNGEEGLKYEVNIDGVHLEHLLEFKYLGICFGLIGYRVSLEGGECEEGYRWY